VSFSVHHNWHEEDWEKGGYFSSFYGITPLETMGLAWRERKKERKKEAQTFTLDDGRKRRKKRAKK